MLRTILALACAAAFGVAHAEVPVYETVELQARTNLIVNDDGYNVPPGTSFNNISANINDAGQVTFSAGVVPIDGNLSRSGAGIWLGGHGKGAFVAIHEPPAGDPNDPPTMIIADRPGMNSSGEIVYYTSVDGGPYTLRKYDPASGQSAPVSVLPLTPSSFANPAITDDGVIGFKGRLGLGYGLGTVGAGSATLFAVDTNVDEASPYAYIYSPATDNAGRIVCKVSTGDYNHNEVRAFSAFGSSELIVADQATDPDSPFAKFDNGLAVNDHGEIALALSLADGNVRAIYRFTPNGDTYDAVEIARKDVAGVIRDIDSFAPAINNDGLVVFRASDANGQAIYAGDGKSLVRVVGKGDVVPTDLGAAQLGQHDTSPIFSGAPTVNARGDVAFVAGVHPEGDNQVEWGNGVFVAYAPADPEPDDTIFSNGFEIAPTAVESPLMR